MVHILLLAATLPDAATFAACAVIVLVGAIGVVVARNPVHSALNLIMTLFGVAVLFVEEQANFLAAVQVIVYAGAIVVLFLFVIMLLGVDKIEQLGGSPLRRQGPAAVLLGAMALAEVLLLARTAWPTGARSVAGAASAAGTNVAKLGRSIFTTYLLPFEATSILLVIAVIGAVVLARRLPRQGRLDSSPGAESSEVAGPSGSRTPDPRAKAAAGAAAAEAASGAEGRS